MKRFIFVLSLLLFVGFNLIQGQGVQVAGNVTGADDGAALPGVSVVVKGTTIGAVTDFEGNYAISVPDASATIMFSFVGMLTQEVVLSGQTVVDVILESTSMELDEVVVTALGVSREKKSLGYAVQEIDGEDVNKVQTDNVVNSLSGKLADKAVGIRQGPHERRPKVEPRRQGIRDEGLVLRPIHHPSRTVLSRSCSHGGIVLPPSKTSKTFIFEIGRFR